MRFKGNPVPEEHCSIRRVLHRIQVEGSCGKAELFLPFAEDFDSDHVEELKGFADGSKLPFGEIFALSCHELSVPHWFQGVYGRPR